MFQMTTPHISKVTNGAVIMVGTEDFARLEDKVNSIADALNKLILVEERQLTQGERIGKLEAELAATKEKLTLTKENLDRWVNRGIGVWVAVGTIAAMYEFGVQVFHR
jgi:molybdopterin converting factor small subunit